MGASTDTLTSSEKTITYRLTLRTFRGGPVGILYFFFELVIFRGGAVKKTTLYNGVKLILLREVDCLRQEGGQESSHGGKGREATLSRHLLQSEN